MTRAVGVDELRWLVRIETTSNQAFLAMSSRVRHLVAASELLSRSTTQWVTDALDALPAGQAHVVTAVSGVAILLVDDDDTGRAIVRAVTSRAIDEAPGLIIHGALVELPTSDGRGFAEAMHRSALRLARLRSETGDGAAAHLMLPLVAPCPFTGRPSVGLLPPSSRRGGLPGLAQGGPVSAFVLTVEKERLRDAAFERMVGLTFRDSEAEGSERSKRRRVDDMKDFMLQIDRVAEDSARWMAVIHADGNGIGGVFVGLGPRLVAMPTLQDAADLFAAVSQEVDRAAIGALQAAAAAIHTGEREVPAVILPLVCAGDDLTVLVEAGSALALTLAYANEFESCTEDSEIIEGDGLTVAAGIAVTKPGHPILFGLGLAGELTDGAKRIGRAAAGGGRPPATLDVHVVHGSGSLGLDDARAAVGRAGQRLPRSAGPWLVTDGGVSAPDAGVLERLIIALVADDSPVRALAQRLRAAAEVGRDDFDDVVRRALLQAGGAAADDGPLATLSRAGCDLVAAAGEGAAGDRQRAVLLDALTLVGVLTAADRRRVAEEASR